MSSEQFVFWLQGFFELSDSANLSEKQVTIIKNHLNLVFAHDIDPKAGNAEKQKLLNKIHGNTGTHKLRC